MALSGLEVTAGQTILTLKGLSGSEHETRQLVECYRGNPLALKIAATSIRDLHEGNIARFLVVSTELTRVKNRAWRCLPVRNCGEIGD